MWGLNINNMAKKNNDSNNGNQNKGLDAVSIIPENSVVTIIFLANGKDVKEDIEKKVSGNVANILINKGLAKLKN